MSGLWHDLPCNAPRPWTLSDSLRLLFAYLAVFALLIALGATAGALFHRLDRDQFGARTSRQEQTPGGFENRAPSFSRGGVQGRRK